MILVGKKFGNRCESALSYKVETGEITFLTKSACCEKEFDLSPYQAINTFRMDRSTATQVEQDVWEFNGGTFV